jgi:hypothetical protein
VLRSSFKTATSELVKPECFSIRARIRRVVRQREGVVIAIIEEKCAVLTELLPVMPCDASICVLTDEMQHDRAQYTESRADICQLLCSSLSEISAIPRQRVTALRTKRFELKSIRAFKST